MKATLKVLHWTPRIICILAIVLISLFAFDSFNSDLTLRQQIGKFLLSLIPSFVLIAVLIVAWKWEYIGGIIFTLIGLGFSPFIYFHNYKMNDSVWLSLVPVLMITIPIIIVGLLFILSSYKKKEHL